MNIAPQKPLEVYLDSSDFSTLSNAKTLTPEFSKILNLLKEYRSTNKVNFRFSGVHVTEIAPVEAKENFAAEMRAELIFELCGSHAMIDRTRLLECEVKAEVIDAFSNSGRWYPSIEGLLPDNIGLLTRSVINEALNEEGLNREQRRMSKKAILNRKGFKPKIAELLKNSNADRAKTLVESFPFTDAEELITVEYFQTSKNRERAEAAFLRVLTDPRWLVKKLATSPKDLEAIAGWLRINGNNFATVVSQCTSELQHLRVTNLQTVKECRATIDSLAGSEFQGSLINVLSSHVQKSANQLSKLWQSVFLRTANLLANSVADGCNSSSTSCLTQEESFLRHPGISTLVAVLMHSVNSAVEIKPRPVKVSDLGDAMHAIYAPYVDIFRTDGFMANPIQRATARYGTKVVGNLRDLPAAIDAAIRSG